MAELSKYSWFIASLGPRKILYIGKNECFIWRGGGIEEVGAGFKGKARFVVLGKEFYFETIRSFPFANLGEIRDAVKTDMATFSPFETELFFAKKIGGTGEHTSVNLWFVSPGILKRLRQLSPFLLIPETALFALHQDSKGTLYEINRNSGESLFCYIGRDGGVRSTLSHGEQPDLQGFRRSVGREARDSTIKRVRDNHQYAQLLWEMLLGGSLLGFSPFLTIRSFSSGLEWPTVKRGLATALVMFLIYTFLSAFLPFYHLNRLIKEDKAISTNLASLLKKQELIDDFCRKERALAGKINAYPYKLPIILTINNALPDKARIEQLTISGNKVVIRGVAPKASQVLSALSSARGVKEAGFSSPLRKDRKSGMEIFTLTFVSEN